MPLGGEAAACPASVADLEAALARPGPALVAALARVEGDLLVLGAGGKMGPSLARLAANAFAGVPAPGPPRRVIAVSRFSQPAVRAELERHGVRTLAADLLDEGALAGLPDAPNVVFMAGQKFGTAGREALTWALNVHLPALVARRYRRARIVAFSTGNVYPLTAPGSGGCDEGRVPAPVGEYAQSCLGRERAFEHASRTYGTPVALIRLNYAIDLRYGVLLDVARAVREGRPVDLRMGQVNVIWQGDANAMALRALPHAASPPLVLNVTGPETLSVRWLAEAFGRRFGVAPVFAGGEEPGALLSNAGRAFALFGYPRVPLGRLVDWTADWLAHGRPTLERPTHFQEREGRF